jgi:lipopolysaccharide/colanic/teichoic acid biosynthesis glycosyltransferase
VVATLVTIGVLASVIGLGALATGIDIHRLVGGNAPQAAVALGGWAGCLGVVQLAFGYALRNKMFVRRLVLVTGEASTQPAVARFISVIQNHCTGFYEVVGTVPAHDARHMTHALLGGRRIWGMIVFPTGWRELPPEKPAAWGKVRIWDEAAFWEAHLRRVDIDHPAATRRLQEAARQGRLHGLTDRTVDIIFSLLLLGFTLPLLVLVALLIRLDSPGPAFYVQDRVGMNGRIFRLLKFRSMREDAEARGPVWARKRDPRVTRVGAFIRLTRIDELPQLLNVLAGDMSLIGPRPERPTFAEQLAEQIPFWRERTRVKPGMTGWAQVNYPYGASVEDARTKLSYDLYYIKYCGFALKMTILLSTLRVVLLQKGAR